MDNNLLPPSSDLAQALETVALGIRSTVADLTGNRDKMPADQQALLFRELVKVRGRLQRLFGVKAVAVYGK